MRRPSRTFLFSRMTWRFREREEEREREIFLPINDIYLCAALREASLLSDDVRFVLPASRVDSRRMYAPAAGRIISRNFSNPWAGFTYVEPFLGQGMNYLYVSPPGSYPALNPF